MRKIIAFVIALTFCIASYSVPIKSMIGVKGQAFVAQPEDGFLPDGVIAVEYLESSGEQWIMTDLIFTESDDIDIEYHNVTSLDSTGRHLQGWRTLGASYWGASNGKYDRLGATPRILCRENDLVRIIRNGTPGAIDECIINGEINYQTSAFSKYGGRLVLFALDNGGSYSGSWRIGEIKVIVNGEMSAYYVPIRIINEDGVSEGAYYDIVSGKMLFNNVRSTKPLIIGPDKE